MYTVVPGWIDTAGRTRTWYILDPAGKRFAEITRKGVAGKLAAILSKMPKEAVSG